MRPAHRAALVIFGREPKRAEVRVAIRAALTALHVRPEAMDRLIHDVMSGRRDRGGNHVIARTRAYAATALFELFDVTRSTASRLCGIPRQSWKAHLCAINQARRYDRAPWFTDEKLFRVKKAITLAGGDVLALVPPRPVEPPKPRTPVETASIKLITYQPPTAPEPSNIFGDPDPSRCALATAKPWLPYEQTEACRAAWAREDAKR